MNKKLDFINSKADHLLELLKGDNHSSKSTNTLIFVIALYILVAAIHFIKVDFSLLLGLSVVAFVVLLILYRFSMQSAIRENTANSNYDSFKDVDPMTHLRTKLQYIYSGIMIKHTRTKSIRVIYAVLFPFILLMIKEVFQGQIEKYIFTLIFLAILFGSSFWWYFFGDELDDLSISRDDIRGYLESI